MNSNVLEKLKIQKLSLKDFDWREFPWWFVALTLVSAITLIVVLTNPAYHEAFLFIIAGLGLTAIITLAAFSIAVVLGLVTGLSRISDGVFAKNAATFYVELVRGVPMLVLMFFIAYVLVPGFVTVINELGGTLSNAGLSGIGSGLSALGIRDIPMTVRAVIALSLTYGAFLAEVFRAGIQSISRGQMEAARSQGMSYGQAMRYVILPQAIRNVLPALGNDFISMLKDSSLVSVLAVRDITQVARLYVGHSFRFAESYTSLAILYLVMTVSLSLGVKVIERRYANYDR
ncbi:MAG: amino acid ABC transporter permease [Anaerolineaceae bacterium]|nr:amino acid ABC transporter permease [Anaerolineaceae bacterium]